MPIDLPDVLKRYLHSVVSPKCTEKCRLWLPLPKVPQALNRYLSFSDSAKYAARLGQSFGSSKETLKVKADDIELIPDVEIFSLEKRYPGNGKE
ncbi:hypothetical protein Bca101_089648 [Brassica carinata]